MLAQERIDVLAERLFELANLLESASQGVTAISLRTNTAKANIANRIAAQGKLVEASEASIKAISNKLQLRAAKLDEKLRDGNSRVEAVLQEIEAVRPTDTSRREVVEVCESVDAALDYAENTIQEAVDEFSGMSEQVIERLETVGEEVESFIARMKSEIAADADELRSSCHDMCLMVVHEATGSMVSSLQNAAKTDITNAIDEQGQRIGDELSEKLNSLLDRLASRLRVFLAQLKERMAQDDESAQAKRLEISEALDALRSAIPPLESAFQAFSSLAKSVGI